MPTRSKASKKLIDELIVSQAGVISRRQLLRMGMSDSGIQKRIEIGSLHRVYQGSYSLLGEIGREALWWAGVLASGDLAVLSHMSAAHAWGIVKHSGPTEVTRTTSGGRKSELGVRSSELTNESARLAGHMKIPILTVHTTRRLDRAEVTRCDGIPITTVARTLVDLAGSVDKRKLERIVHEAGREGRLNLEEVDTAMLKARGKKGVRKLRRIMDLYVPETAATRNEFETRMLAALLESGHPRPLVNQTVAGYEVDFFWPEHGLILEADGATDHSSPVGVERDKERDAVLQIRGFLVLRITWAMLQTDPRRCLEKVGEHIDLCRRQGRRATRGWGSASTVATERSGGGSR